MADYSDAYRRKCCPSSVLGSHEKLCPNNPNYLYEKFGAENNMMPVYADNSGWKQLIGYKCNRGCGTIVWDPEAHIKNVCRSDNG